MLLWHIALLIHLVSCKKSLPIPAVSQKSKIDVQEGIEDCTKPDERLDYFDLNELNIFVNEDLTAFLNGTFKFLKDVSAPFRVLAYTEEYRRGEWVPWIMRKDISDWCHAMHSPTEFWYHIMQNNSGCPLKAGVS